MRKLLFFILWILIALALPYSLKAQTVMSTTTSSPSHGIHYAEREAPGSHR